VLPNIQEYLIPRRPSSRYAALEVAHIWLPLEPIGGDFLYYERINDDFITIEVGDVTGHGTQAGLVMTALHGLFFGLRAQLVPVDNMMMRANDFLCRLQQVDTRDPRVFAQQWLCSMFLLRVDFKNRSLTYCNAGHPPGLYLPNGTDGEIMPLKSGGLILGAIPNGKYTPAVLRPASGDLVLLFTDGVSEAVGPTGHEFGVERLEQALRELRDLPPRDIASQITNRVNDFRKDATATDDIAMAILKFGQNW
jgi:sigma-B regulation protein RsbU (phosphoserine phosphatase)